jgi:hypothetical protein
MPLKLPPAGSGMLAPRAPAPARAAAGEYAFGASAARARLGGASCTEVSRLNEVAAIPAAAKAVAEMIVRNAGLNG